MNCIFKNDKGLERFKQLFLIPIQLHSIMKKHAFRLGIPKFLLIFADTIDHIIQVDTTKNDSIMSDKSYINKLSPHLFWDIDMELADMDTCPSQIIQRVLEYGTLEDWRLIHRYYGLDKIVEECKKMRTLDKIALSFICCKSKTNKEDYRCYHTKNNAENVW